ncbi:MAG: UDP-N-acetylglucosamine 1-carboxyvinyltransferase, partial [Desulfobulbaceae bacterium]
ATGMEVKETETTITLDATGGRQINSVDITTMPYPGYPTDLQAQFMCLMAMSEGVSMVHETIFENRFMHVAELHRMGADITTDGHTAVVKGVGRTGFYGAPVMATDLRASSSLVIAGLAAKGRTEISRIYHLERGYEQLVEKMTALGATVWKEEE